MFRVVMRVSISSDGRCARATMYTDVAVVCRPKRALAAMDVYFVRLVQCELGAAMHCIRELACRKHLFSISSV